ncbi:MAG: AIM24 family protein [Treponema sp.]|nr:AIM24 family protein [Treponema sp.]
MNKKIVWVIILSVFVCAFAFSQEIRINNTEDWTSALRTIANSGNNKRYTLVINDRIAVPGDFGVEDPNMPGDSGGLERNIANVGYYSFSFGNASNITVTLRGNGTLFLSSPGYMFRIKGGQTLTIDSEHLTLQGLSMFVRGPSINNNSPIIDIMTDSNGRGGNLNLINGTLCYNVNEGIGGGGVSVGYGGTFTMSGGRISDNMTLEIFGGGGVLVWNGGSFIMRGGTIISNIASFRSFTGAPPSGRGGGVSILYGSFVKTGGIIYGNDAADVEDSNLANFGQAVYFVTPDANTGGYYFFCNHSLDATRNGNISTRDTLPSRNDQSARNWSRRAGP